MKNTYYINLDTGEISKELPDKHTIEYVGVFTTRGYKEAREVAKLCRAERWREARDVANRGLKENPRTK